MRREAVRRTGMPARELRRASPSNKPHGATRRSNDQRWDRRWTFERASVERRSAPRKLERCEIRRVRRLLALRTQPRRIRRCRRSLIRACARDRVRTMRRQHVRAIGTEARRCGGGRIAILP